jgi:hypothetical protein
MNIGPTIRESTVIISTILEIEFFQGVLKKCKIPAIKAPE